MELVSHGVQDALQANAMHPTPSVTRTQDIQDSMDNLSSDASTTSLPDLASVNSATLSITQDSATVLSMKTQMDMMQKMMLQMQQKYAPLPTSCKPGIYQTKTTMSVTQSSSYRKKSESAKILSYPRCLQS